MPIVLIIIIAIIAPLSLVAGVLVLLGKFDNLLLKNAAKNGRNVNIALQRKVVGIALLSDAVVIPAMLAAIFYFCK